MGRKRRNHVLRLAKLRKEQEALKSNEEAVKVSSNDLDDKPMVEPTLEPKIALKAENEAPVEVKKTEAVKKPIKKTTTRRSTKKATTTPKTTTKSTTRRRKTTKKKGEETKNAQS